MSRTFDILLEVGDARAAMQFLPIRAVTQSKTYCPLSQCPIKLHLFVLDQITVSHYSLIEIEFTVRGNLSGHTHFSQVQCGRLH